MRSLSGKTAIVAGGAGFLGSHLCDALLAKGARVVCIDNFQTGDASNLDHLRRESRFDLINQDIIAAPPPELARHGADLVFNLACAASPVHYQADPEHTMLTCVVGTRNLLHLAEQTGALFVLASTSEVYGDPDVHPQRESYWGNVNPTGPRACYDEGKRAAEALSFDYARACRADVRVARIFNTYGPRMRGDDGRVVSNLITQALDGEPVTIYGRGDQTRSFCYVSDTIDALVRMGEHPEPIKGPINVGTTIEIAVGELATRVLAMTGSPSRVVFEPLPTDDPRRRRPDITLARQVLDWSPQVPLEDGLRATIDWFASEQARTATPRLSPRAAAASTLQMGAMASQATSLKNGLGHGMNASVGQAGLKA